MAAIPNSARVIVLYKGGPNDGHLNQMVGVSIEEIQHRVAQEIFAGNAASASIWTLDRELCFERRVNVRSGSGSPIKSITNTPEEEPKELA